MSGKLTTAIEKTLRYGDQFDFAMTQPELEQYLIGHSGDLRVIPAGEFERIGEYFVTRGRERLVKIRKTRNAYTHKKITRAIQLSNWLRIFPGVRMVGITGSVAAGTAKRLDDIVLMRVTAAGRLWLTRLLVLCLMCLPGLNRPARSVAP